MGASCATEDSKPRMTLSTSWIWCSRPRAALALSRGGPRSGTPSATPQRCHPAVPLPWAPEHSLLPVEAAEKLHIAVLVLDTVEGHGQVQGGGAHQPAGQKHLTLPLGRLFLCSQALQPLGCALRQGGAGSEVSFLGGGGGQTLPTRPQSMVCMSLGTGQRPGDSPGPESPHVDDLGPVSLAEPVSSSAE